MTLPALISPSRIRSGVEVGSRREAVQMLAQVIAADLGIEAEPLREALQERESLGSTVIGRGVALPHAKSPAVAEPAAAMLLLGKPLSCTTPDSVPVDIFVAFVVPEEGNDLALLAPLVKELRDEALLRGLRSAESPAAAHAEFSHNGQT